MHEQGPSREPRREPGNGDDGGGSRGGHECGGYDAELRGHQEVLRRASTVRPDDRVLDIGCGTGQTTREAARTALRGAALGVDVSAPAIAAARELARAEGLFNVEYEQADARTYPFPSGHFDLAISRFGTMFFAEPVAAFTNIGQALRPSGRLVMMVWQSRESNEWDRALRRGLAGLPGPEPEPSAFPDPFSLARPSSVRRILEGAGFADIAFTDVREPVHYGADTAAALDWASGFVWVRERLRTLPPAASADALARLRATLAEHVTDAGVCFDSRAWLITARRTGRHGSGPGRSPSPA
ncbi:methyltransferase domain-containing protein [Streptomyces sp. NPDC008150]|uniref:class I SAM-dependent methyltransferase n=1 Tax=Streptomyces sp. NPDC008150 TaxID=3364816 RepID=UPI0036E59C68